MKKFVSILAALMLVVMSAVSMVSAEDIVFSSGFSGMCKQKITNGFYYMYRDMADGGKVKEFPSFNISATSENCTVNMAWTLSKTLAFPFMTNYSQHPEVGLNPILQWRAEADGTVVFKSVEMGATFDPKIGEIRKSAIFMNPGYENPDGVTITIYKNNLKSTPIKTGLVTDKSDFTFNETIKVKKGDSISLEYDSNTSKSGDSCRGLFELTFTEGAASTSSTIKSSTTVSSKSTAASSTAASDSTGTSSTTDGTSVESTASSETGSTVESTDSSTVSENASVASQTSGTESKTDDTAGFPGWAIALIIVVVVAGGGAIAYVLVKGKK